MPVPRRDHRPGPLPDRARVRRHRVGGQRQPPYAQRSLQGARAAPRAAASPSVAIPAAPIATRRCPRRCRAARPCTGPHHALRAAGSSCPAVPGVDPAGPVRTGSAQTPVASGPSARPRPSATRSPEPPESTARTYGWLGGARSRQAPVHRLRPLAHQQVVGPAERPRAEEPAVGRHGGGVRGLDAGKSPSSGRQIAGVAPPQDRHQRRAARASARIACSVTSSQPLPRCAAGCAGRGGQRPVEQQHALPGPRASGRRWTAGAARGRVCSSRKMFSRLPGSGRTSGATEKLSPTACPGVGYGS